MKLFKLSLLFILTAAHVSLCHSGHKHSHGHAHEDEKIDERKTLLFQNFNEKLSQAYSFIEAQIPVDVQPHFKKHMGSAKEVFDVFQEYLISFKQFIVKTLAETNSTVAVLISTALIAFTPLIIINLVPQKLPEFILMSLVGFAVGTLFGDVFLHILPHSFAHGNEFDHMLTGLSIVAGLVGFILLDKFIRALGGGHSHSHHEHEHHHKKDGSSENLNDFSSASSSAHSRFQSQDGLRKRNAGGQDPYNTPVTKVTHSHHEHHHHHSHGSSSAGYLTVIANIIHTMSDGFTLAVANYQSDPIIAFSTALAIFLHEIPHKIGDYAIMRKSGFSKGYAILMQFLFSIGTILGALVGIYLNDGFSVLFPSSKAFTESSIEGYEKWILCATAGGLLYTACVGILPEILESKGIFNFIFCVASLINGVLFMTLITLTE